MKFVANLLVAIHNVAAAEAIVLAMKAGLDPAMVVKVIGDGAGSSRMFQVRGPLMAKGDYSDATMKLDVWQKDMTIIADFARQLGCPTPLFAATAPIYTAARAMGGQQDTAAVCAVLEKMAVETRGKFKVQSSKFKVSGKLKVESHVVYASPCLWHSSRRPYRSCEDARDSLASCRSAASSWIRASPGTRASRRIRRPPRKPCGASTGTRRGTGLFGRLGSWIVPMWRLAAAARRLPAPRRWPAVDGRSPERPMQNSVVLSRDPTAASTSSVQREGRVETLEISGGGATTSHFAALHCYFILCTYFAL